MLVNYFWNISLCEALYPNQFAEINELRNQVFHYEPVWSNANLKGTHEKICKAIGWVSSDMRHVIARFDRFPVVYQSGREHIEAELMQHFKR